MPKTPSYRQRFNQGLVTLTDSKTGKRRDYWLGRFGAPESREAYFRVLAEWEAAGRRWPETRALESHPTAPDHSVVTVLAVVRAYWRWARQYYRPNESGTLKVALRLLKQYCGRTPACEFGPKKLRLLREAMVRGDASAASPAGVRNRALLAVLYRTGLRISEALALLPKDLDLDGGAIRVLRGKGGYASASIPARGRDGRRLGGCGPG